MIAFLRLIRIQNLLIIAFMQYAVRWCLIFPILKARSSYYTLQLSEWQFFLLVLSTVLVAASGYIINDYFDVRTDKVNKPERLIIDRGVKRRVAMIAHQIINVLALGIGIYISYSIGVVKLAFAHFLCISGLWFYSTTFKKQFLIGNVVIAVFTAMVPVAVAVYELIPCYKAYLPLDPELNFKGIWIYTGGIAFFTFVISLMRGIIHDMEKMDGDKEYGYRTMPIVIGLKYSKVTVHAIILLLLLFITYYQYQQIQLAESDWLSFFYLLIAVDLPLIYLEFKLLKANNRIDFKKIDFLVKGIMFAGICYLFVFAYIVLHFIKMI